MRAGDPSWGVRRETVLGGLLLALSALAAVVLAEVLATVVFAITVAYVLSPVRRELVERGLSDRGASAAATTGAAVAVVAVVSPLGYVTYRRRSELVDLLQRVPETIPLSFGGAQVVLETGPLLATAQAFVRDAALAAAAAAPVLALKLTLFAIVVYGLLYRPGAVRDAVRGFVPDAYHDVLQAMHRRTRQTLLGIYVLQAATALGTTVIAFLVFWALGFEAAASLAVIAGILQFVPVVGPSLLVLALAAADLVAGNPTRAVLVLVFGLSLVGFLPDAVIRPRLSHVASRLPMTLYFVGFVGGVLTVGSLGFVLGPLVVALLVEAVQLLSAERRTPAVG